MKKLASGSLTVKAASFDDVIKCLQVNFPKLGSKIRKHSNIFDSIIVIVDDNIIANAEILNDSIRNGKTIELIPVQVFSAIFTAAATATLLTKALVFVANVVVISALSFGISFLISKLLAPKDPKQVKTSSYILGSKTNIAARNTPIPIGYGKLRVASYVASSYAVNFDYEATNPGSAAGTSIGFVGGVGSNPTIQQKVW